MLRIQNQLIQQFPVINTQYEVSAIFVGVVEGSSQKYNNGQKQNKGLPQILEKIPITKSSLPEVYVDIVLMQQLLLQKCQIYGQQIQSSFDRKDGKKEILDEIKQLFNKDQDASIFYFSGHGLPNGELLVEHKDKGQQEITFDQVYELWKQRNKRQQFCLVILDCCHAGSWIKQLKEKQDYSLAILASCQEDEQAYHSGETGRQIGSYFTWNLRLLLEKCEDDKRKIIDLKQEKQNPQFWGCHYKVYNMLGFPLFMKTKQEMQSFIKDKMFMQTKIYNEGKYEGQLQNQLRHGLGRFTWNNQYVYEGEWLNDKRNGFGTLKQYENVKYEGEWNNDYPKIDMILVGQQQEQISNREEQLLQQFLEKEKNFQSQIQQLQQQNDKLNFENNDLKQQQQKIQLKLRQQEKDLKQQDKNHQDQIYQLKQEQIIEQKLFQQKIDEEKKRQEQVYQEEMKKQKQQDMIKFQKQKQIEEVPKRTEKIYRKQLQDQYKEHDRQLSKLQQKQNESKIQNKIQYLNTYQEKSYNYQEQKYKEEERRQNQYQEKEWKEKEQNTQSYVAKGGIVGGAVLGIAALPVGAVALGRVDAVPLAIAGAALGQLYKMFW